MEVAAAVEVVFVEGHACCYDTWDNACEGCVGHDEVVDGGFGAEAVH